MTTYPLLIDGEAVTGETTLPVVDKFTGRQIAEVACASRAQVARAVQAAAAAFAARRLPP